MQVGTTKDRGLYNKPSAAVHPGALAAGTLPQYNVHMIQDYKREAYLCTFVHMDVKLTVYNIPCFKDRRDSDCLFVLFVWSYE